MRRHTIADVAEALDVEKDAARGLVKFLESVGLVEVIGERRPENGQGRAEIVYQFQEGFAGSLADLLEAAALDT